MNTLNELNSVILDSADMFEQLVSYYGEDHWNFQTDILLLTVLSYLIDNACWFNLTENKVNQLYMVANQIQLYNKQIKFEKPTIKFYKNFNSKQTYNKFKEIKEYE